MKRRFIVVGLAAVLAAGLLLGVGLSSVSAQDKVIEIPVDTVVRGESGSIHLLERADVPTDMVDRECKVAAEGKNNESVHPNSDLLVRSGQGEVVLADVEREANVRTEASGTLKLAEEISVFLRMGPDEVFSAGMTVELTCPEKPSAPPVTVEQVSQPPAPVAPAEAPQPPAGQPLPITGPEAAAVGLLGSGGLGVAIRSYLRSRRNLLDTLRDV